MNRVLAATLSVITILPAARAEAQEPITLNFTSLPSAQGWTYFSRSGTDEHSVFSVDGSMLHQDTMSTPCVEQDGDPFALCDRDYYTMGGVVDPSLPFVLEVRARVLAENQPPFQPFGFGFAVTSGTESVVIFLGPSVIRILDATLEHAQEIPYDNQVFHTYRVEGSFVDGGWRLLVDNTPVASGTALPADPCGCAGLLLGDVDAGGNARADVSSYRFFQPVAPTITSLSATPSVLWPPNHKMSSVSVNVTATGTLAPSCQISAVTSNEGGVIPGEAEWEVTQPLVLNLRAERKGDGPGRAYTVTVTCTNDGGSASRTVAVVVPHDQR